MGNEQVSITVGIPTYNRPEGLDCALRSALSQESVGFKVLVSDNCSNNPEVRRVLERHAQKDGRLEFVIQPNNRGPAFNFNYLFAACRSPYFMWLADDDYWERPDHLANLLGKSNANTALVFPNVNLNGDDGTVQSHVLTSVYGNCSVSRDYLRAWCSHGSGWPFYGLYNLQAMARYGLTFTFDSDLAYYSEGTFLHRFFLCGAVSFCEEAVHVYAQSSKRPSQDKLIRAYFEYTSRVIALYRESEHLDEEFRHELISTLCYSHFAYLRDLCGADIRIGRPKSIRERAARAVKRAIGKRASGSSSKEAA